MSRLECRGVTIASGQRTIVEAVDLDVPTGSLTVLVGPSGTGKTTLLRAVAGLAPVAHGVISLDGRDLARVPTHRRGVAMLFQEPRLFPNLDVAENVAFPLRLGGIGRRRRRARAADLLAEVGLEGFAHRNIRALSGGEQQGVALARALAADPSVLLLDEPLSALDPDRRETLRSLLRQTQRRRGLTMLHVTHDQAEAAELADQLVIMLDGRVVASGAPRGLFERPPSAAVARFLGAKNVVPGHSAHLDAFITIRPERVRLDPAATLRLQVMASTYQGSHRRLQLRGPDLELEAHVSTDHDPPVGEWVGVELPADHLWEIPA